MRDDEREGRDEGGSHQYDVAFQVGDVEEERSRRSRHDDDAREKAGPAPEPQRLEGRLRGRS